MLELILNDNDGDSVCKSIKDKDKAAVRFVCGRRILGATDEPTINRWNEYDGSFGNFGDRALALGANHQDIVDLFNSTLIPDSIREKRAKYFGKKMDSMYVSFISKAIIDAGFDIVYLHNGRNAITREGIQAMESNGRKWTIGYNTEIIVRDTKYLFNFDAITCEGGGPTSYVIHGSSSRIFSNISEWARIGKTEFKTSIIKALNEAA